MFNYLSRWKIESLPKKFREEADIPIFQVSESGENTFFVQTYEIDAINNIDQSKIA